jgi:hypothetical protein
MHVTAPEPARPRRALHLLTEIPQWSQQLGICETILAPCWRVPCAATPSHKAVSMGLVRRIYTGLIRDESSIIDWSLETVAERAKCARIPALKKWLNTRLEERRPALVPRFLQPISNAPFVHDHRLTPCDSHVPLGSSVAYHPHTSSTDNPGRFTNCRAFESMQKANVD